MKDTKKTMRLGHKILIIGCAGSGKTTLSKKLNAITNLPIIHMDNHYWTENWGRKPDGEWSEVVKGLCNHPCWIMDGNYSKTMPIRFMHASTIIFLDMPRWQCLLRVFLRRFRWVYNKKRNDIPPDCKERINIVFYRWVWHYPKRSKPETLNLINLYNKPTYHFKNNKAVKDFIAQMHLLHADTGTIK